MSDQNELLEKLITLTEKTNNLLGHVARLLHRQAQDTAPLSPNYRRKLAEYENFDWSSIGAEVVGVDDKGYPFEVEWRGHRFDRSSGTKFDAEFIIFSRPGADWTQTNKVYYTLIKFANYNKTPILPPEQRQQSAPPPPPAQALSAAEYRQRESRRRRAGITKQPDQPQPQANGQGDPPAGTVWCEKCGQNPALPGQLCPACNAAGPGPQEIEAESQTRPPANLAPAQGENARQAFYRLGSEAVNQQVIEIPTFNNLVATANRDGFDAALSQLQAAIGGSA